MNTKSTDESHSITYSINDQAAKGETSEEIIEQNIHDAGISGEPPQQCSYEQDERTLIEEQQPKPTYEMAGPGADAVRQDVFDKALAEESAKCKAEEPQAQKEKTIGEQCNEASELLNDRIYQNAVDMNIASSSSRDQQDAVERGELRSPDEVKASVEAQGWGSSQEGDIYSGLKDEYQKKDINYSNGISSDSPDIAESENQGQGSSKRSR